MNLQDPARSCEILEVQEFKLSFLARKIPFLQEFTSFLQEKIILAKQL